MSELIFSMPTPAQWAVSFFLALFPLVLVHELGHFAVAKLNHVRVDEFGVGFPPRAWRMAKVGDTEYTLNWLPIGGFVRLAGEDDPTVPGAFAGKSKAVRTAVLLAGPFANFAFAAAILVAVALSGPVPQALAGIEGTSLVDVSPDSPAAVAGLQPWDIAVAVNGEPLADIALKAPAPSPEQAPVLALQQTTQGSVGKPMRLAVVRGSTVVRVDELPADMTTRPADIPGVSGRVVVTAPPAGAVRPGDLVLSASTETEREALELSPVGNRPLVLRGAELTEVTVVPKADAAGIGRIGVALNSPVLPVQLGLAAAVTHGLRLTGQMSVALLVALAEMVQRTRAVDLRGPLGIAEISSEASRQGLDVFLSFMALLSINFAVINLLPIPALDGGRLLFIGAEAIRGKRVEPSREAVVHLIGFALVLALMVVLTVSDLAAMSERFRSVLASVTSAIGGGP